MMVYMGKLETAAGFIGLLIMMFCQLALAETEYYTWIDENGVVNYAEHNPQGYEALFVTGDQRFGLRNPLKPTLEPELETTGTTAATIEEEDEVDIDVQISRERERIDKEIAKAKRSNCNIGKLNLAQLENYNRIRVQGDDGAVRVLTEEEKASRVSRARETIRENCNA